MKKDCWMICTPTGPCGAGCKYPQCQESSALSAAARTCPKCKGSGDVQAMTQHLGPDDYEVTIPCPECKGTGAPSSGGVSCPCTPADRVECHAMPDTNRPANCALRSAAPAVRFSPDEIDLICDHYIAEVADFQCPPNARDAVREALHTILRRLPSATAHNFDPKRDVACTKGEYIGLVKNSRRYEWLRDNMRRMPLGEAGTRHFFDQSGSMSFQEAVDVAMSASADRKANDENTA